MYQQNLGFFVLLSRVKKVLVEQYLVKCRDCLKSHDNIISHLDMLALPSNQYTVSFLNFSILAQHKDVCILVLFTHGYIKKRGVQDILPQPSTIPIATEDNSFPNGSVNTQ